MKVGLDVNLSPKLVDALNALYGTDQLTFERVGSAPDSVWLPEFANNGGTAFIGKDKRILSRPNEVRALHASRLTGFFLNYGKSGAGFSYIAAHVIFWWPKIETLIREDPCLVFRVPGSMRSHDGLERLAVDESNSPPRVKAIQI